MIGELVSILQFICSFCIDTHRINPGDSAIKKASMEYSMLAFLIAEYSILLAYKQLNGSDGMTIHSLKIDLVSLNHLKA